MRLVSKIKKKNSRNSQDSTIKYYWNVVCIFFWDFWEWVFHTHYWIFVLVCSLCIKLNKAEKNVSILVGNSPGLTKTCPSRSGRGHQGVKCYRDCRRIRTYEGISQRMWWVYIQVRRLNHSARQPLLVQCQKWVIKTPYYYYEPT